MPTFRRYTVQARLPSSLERLRTLSGNLWWSWSPIAHSLFIKIDAELWEEVHGNPIELLARAPQKRLEELAQDDVYLSQLDAAWQKFEHYMNQPGWFARTFPNEKQTRIGYFSMEYGLHESLPIYSGGLGVLAGDHLKTASDLGLPLVGVGLAYAEGYFRQVLNGDGLQTERYPINDWSQLPVKPVCMKDGRRLIIDVAYPGKVIHAQLWRVDVGRVPLYLLDSNVEQNAKEDRGITGPLYGGDHEFRVRQEIMLGIGGVHALEALGLRPNVCHLNEGHSSFLTLERIARVMREKKVSFEVAREACAPANLFTTHTPVPAGIDMFDPAIVRRYLDHHRRELGLTEAELTTLGKSATAPTAFSMPILALKTSAHCNGVSELHGEVSRTMFKSLWPDVPEHEVPIDSITNGVHVPSFVSDELGAVYSRYLGDHWVENLDKASTWAKLQQVPDAELWHTHENRRARLVQLARRWLVRAAKRRGASADEIQACQEVLDPHALTIGFARRFATYKRATLLFQDIERVYELLGDTSRPVQLIFAGKAHPQDKPGKELIRSIVHEMRDPKLRGKVVFIEDYDMRIARAMVSGVDVWLNTPRRPMEASGTSGMKAAANGAINLSILDGWFAEAWRDHGRDAGWAIGNGENVTDERGDRLEAERLYEILEGEVVPLFFDRPTADKLPRAWIKRMKTSIAANAVRYNTVRMVREYTERFYVPAARLAEKINVNDLAGAKELVDWKAKVRAAWPKVQLESVELASNTTVTVGDALSFTCTVDLGTLTPDDVKVQAYYGALHGELAPSKGNTVDARVVEGLGGGRYRYEATVPAGESGDHAVAARVIPAHALVPHPHDVQLLQWA
jgi:starch phosphorylase